MALFKKSSTNKLPFIEPQIFRPTKSNHDFQIFIRSAQLSDVSQMVEIQRAVYTGRAPWNDHAFITEISNQEERRYLVATTNDQIIAFIGSAFWVNKNEMHITNLAVLPIWQNQQIGSKLINIVINVAEQIKVKKMSLEVRKSNLDAQRLYQRLGFTIVAERPDYYDDDHEDAFDMEKIIND